MYNTVELLEREKQMKERKSSYILISFLIVAFLCSSLLMAGDASRVGTASGVQVQVPVGARVIGMGGADIAHVSGVEALYWNPAGLGRMEGRASAMFSTRNIIADISVNYLALGFNAGKVGTLGFSMKSFGIGDIPVTTTQNMDGTGAMYSPTFATIGMSYARSLTDHVGVGVTGKVIYESVPRASASSFAADLGLQYDELFNIKGLDLGLAITNIGQDLQYTGSAFLTKATDKSETYEAYRYRTTSSDQLPSTFEIGASYEKSLGSANLLTSVQFQNNNYEQDQIKIGAELSINKMIYLRGGYGLQIEDKDNQGLGKSVYGLSTGAGLKLSLGSADLLVDYAYQPMEYFGNGNMFSIAIAF